MITTYLKWGNTSAFYYLVIPLVLVILYAFFEKQVSSHLNRKFGHKVAAYLSQSLSITKRRLQIAFQAIGLTLVIIAMARPQAGERQQEIKSQGVELLILADVSDSMMAEDVKPSRLTQMKIEMAKILELMPGNKIGIIAFAGSSALLSPLTSDPNALRMYIDSLDTNSVSSQGTNFETALNYAKEAFEKGGLTQGDDSRTTRVILVASDGEDQEKGALAAAETLSKNGIKIYTIAYGTEKGGGIPMRDNYGSMTGYKKDPSGQPILTQVHGDFLKSLADSGGGKFYFAQFNGDHLKQFVNDIGELEKTEFQSNVMTQYDEKFTIPLMFGIIFIFIGLGISDRKNEEEEWKGKYEVGA